MVRWIVASVVVLAAVVVALAGTYLMVASGGAPARGGSPSSGASRPAGGPFDNLSTVSAGELPGRIVYLTRLDCRLREFDLATATDRPLSQGSLCSGGRLVIAPDGSAVAERASSGTVVLTRADGSQIVIGKPVPHGKPPGNFVDLPMFVRDGRRLAYCTYSRTAMATSVVDTASGKRVSTIAGTCQVAFTSQGPAAVRGRSVVVGGRVIYRFPDAIAANTSPGSGNPPEGDPLTANTEGTLLAVATRPVDKRRTVVIQVLRPDGRRVARYTGSSDIAVSFQAFAPTGRSAVVLWSDILQLAPFGVAPGRFVLRYHEDHGAGADEAIWPVAYEPGGAYAVMPREPVVLVAPGTPAPSPVPAIILTAGTLKPLYLLPIDAQAAVWVEP